MFVDLTFCTGASVRDTGRVRTHTCVYLCVSELQYTSFVIC